MSTLNGLLKRVRDLDPKLGAELSKQVRELNKKVPFGLHFERHKPESVRLFGQRITPGTKVHILPPRGKSTITADPVIWTVVTIDESEATLIRAVPGETPEITHADVDNLVAVAEFKDHIFPGLKQTGEVINGPEDAPFHTVINGENYHVLQALTYTHAGKVDAIYIDPPYNTGAKDWKYNNDYVDGEDAYRHSKWLAFMERRLLVAKTLLDPENSVLIVTIDEKEYLRLGMLLEQTFPEARIQMVTSAIKPSGSHRSGEFARVEEYVYFVMFGSAKPALSVTDMFRGESGGEKLSRVTWQGLRRRGSTDWRRTHRPNGFYPIFISEETLTIDSVGDPIPLGQDRTRVTAPSGTWAAWPLDPNGEESRWQVSAERLRVQLDEGTAALRSIEKETGSAAIVYLKGGDLDAVRSGEYKVDGRDEEGKLNVLPALLSRKTAKTMWVMTSHDASAHGTALLTRFIPGRKFPFPKSMYAVEDALRFFVKDKPDAVVLDFFSGSGTTAHAVMRLNKQDGGRRQSISVTNNEVSADEQRKLRKAGLRPGDPEWEALDICDYVTKPRVTAAITGKTHEGEPIKCDYRFTDEFPMADGLEENAAFFTLTYETPLSVRHHRAFERIAPLLWLKAGSRGRIITDL